MQGLLPLQRYFDFSGRSSRAEYWQWILITTIASWIVGIADSTTATAYGQSYKFTMTLYGATAIPWLAVGMRRLHDVGKSGWYYGLVWIFAAISGALVYVGDARRQNTGDDTILGIGTGLFLMFLVYAGYVVYLTIKPGDPKWNDYGHPYSGEPSNDDRSAPIAEQPHHPSATLFPPASPTPAKPAPALPTSSSERDPLEQIERLAQMREAGMLTDEEFEQQKKACLARLS